MLHIKALLRLSNSLFLINQYHGSARLEDTKLPRSWMYYAILAYFYNSIWLPLGKGNKFQLLRIPVEDQAFQN